MIAAMRRTWLAATAVAVAFVSFLPEQTPSAIAGQGHRLGVTIVGARGRVPIREPVTLEGRAQWSGPEAKVTYQWSRVEGSLPYDADLSKRKLVFPADELTPGAYEVKLTVRAEWTDPELEPSEQAVESSSTIAFTVNAPPKGGSCEVDASWSSPKVGRFTITAQGWSDADDRRLQHRFSMTRDGKRRVIENWDPRPSFRLVLPAKEGEAIQFHCEVRDPMGDVGAADAKPVSRP